MTDSEALTTAAARIRKRLPEFTPDGTHVGFQPLLDTTIHVALTIVANALDEAVLEAAPKTDVECVILVRMNDGQVIGLLDADGDLFQFPNMAEAIAVAGRHPLCQAAPHHQIVELGAL